MTGNARPRLAGLYRYLIKSTAGQPLEQARVGSLGLEGDRRYMVSRPDGTFLTARTHPQLQRVATETVAGGLRIRYPERGEMVARESEFAAEPLATGVWGDGPAGSSAMVARGAARTLHTCEGGCRRTPVTAECRSRSTQCGRRGEARPQLITERGRCHALRRMRRRNPGRAPTGHSGRAVLRPH